MDTTVLAVAVLALGVGALIGWLLGSKQAAAAREVTLNLRAQLDAVTQERDSAKPALQELAADSVAAQRSGMWLLACFGALALTLAAAGIYGVMSHMVALRRAEIGIRMTLGAEPRRVMQLLSARARCRRRSGS